MLVDLLVWRRMSTDRSLVKVIWAGYPCKRMTKLRDRIRERLNVSSAIVE